MNLEKERSGRDFRCSLSERMSDYLSIFCFGICTVSRCTLGGDLRQLPQSLSIMYLV